MEGCVGIVGFLPLGLVFEIVVIALINEIPITSTVRGYVSKYLINSLT